MKINERTRATEPYFGFLVLFLSSLLASGILYGALRSSGVFQSRGVELGGAAAGFVVILVISNRIYGGLQDRSLSAIKDEVLAAQRKRINDLEELVSRLRSGELPPLSVPEGFDEFVSRDLGLAYAHPTEWKQSPERLAGIYFRPQDEEALKFDFLGNITVSVSPFHDESDVKSITENDDYCDEILRTPWQKVINLWDVQNVRWRQTYLVSRRAMGVSLEYPNKDYPDSLIKVEGISVFDHIGGRLFIFALYESDHLFEESRELFEKMLSTVTFLS